MRKIKSTIYAASTSASTILAAVLTFAVSGCSAEKKPPETAVRLEAFLALERGTLLEDVRTTLGMPGRHEFSAVVEETRYLSLYFAFEEPYVGFYLVFTNEHLKAVVDPPKPEFYRVPYKDTVREIPKPFDAENRLKAVLAFNDLSREEIDQRIRLAIPKGASSLNMRPAFILASPLYLAKSGEIEADYRTNADLAKRFDPLKVELGDQIEDVEKVFGKPYDVIKESEERVVHVYGSPVSLRINPAFRFSWVTLVFENGKVVRVLSNHFFDKRLLQSQ